MLSLVPVGSKIARRYYTIPTHYTVGDEFESWDAAVVEARGRYETVLAEFIERGTAPTREGCANVAKAAVQVALRWTIEYPDGGGLDTEIERFTDVTALRTTNEPGVLA